MEKTKEDYGIVSAANVNPNYEAPKKDKNPLIDYGAINSFFEELQNKDYQPRAGSFGERGKAWEESFGVQYDRRSKGERGWKVPEGTGVQEIDWANSVPNVYTAMKPLDAPTGAPAITPTAPNAPWASTPEADGFNWGGAANVGIAAVQTAGQMAATWKNKAQTKKEATGQVLSTMSSGAQLGASVGTMIMPGVGTAIGLAGGAIVGGIAGLLGTSGDVAEAEKRRVQLADAKAETDFNKEALDRARFYREKASSQEIQAQLDLYKKSQGYYS